MWVTLNRFAGSNLGDRGSFLNGVCVHMGGWRDRGTNQIGAVPGCCYIIIHQHVWGSFTAIFSFLFFLWSIGKRDLVCMP